MKKPKQPVVFQAPPLEEVENRMVDAAVESVMKHAMTTRMTILGNWIMKHGITEENMNEYDFSVVINGGSMEYTIRKKGDEKIIASITI